MVMPGYGKALLFDIDGTLADTDALHLQAFNQIFGPHGHVFDRARASKELMGFSNTSISERFSVSLRRRHCDDWNADEPCTWRSGRRGRRLHGRSL